MTTTTNPDVLTPEQIAELDAQMAELRRQRARSQQARIGEATAFLNGDAYTAVKDELSRMGAEMAAGEAKTAIGDAVRVLAGLRGRISMESASLSAVLMLPPAAPPAPATATPA